MNYEEINKWFKHEVMNNKNLYPHLYEDEVRRNNYKISGNVFGFRRG